MATVDLIPGLMDSPRSATGPTFDRRVLAWCLLSSLVLIGMGVVRSVQAHRYEVAQAVDTTSPFPLKTIPTEIDGWRMVEASETQLDPLTTRTTGSTDHVIRSYFDETTGVMLSVLVLYGPAEPIMPHVPQVCYPASGFRITGETIDHHLPISDGLNATARSSVFSKSGGRAVLNQAVYHTYRVDDEWTPILAGRRLSNRNTGIFKIQIHRRVFDGERLGVDEPIESFLKKLIPVLEQMNADATRRRNAKLPQGSATETSAATPPPPSATR